MKAITLIKSLLIQVLKYGNKDVYFLVADAGSEKFYRKIEGVSNCKEGKTSLE